MQQAAVRSPFELNETDAYWIEWRKNRPLFSLKEKEQTESRFSEGFTHEQDKTASSYDAAPYSISIHRPQYNAVLERFAAARKQSGAFSAWTT